MCNEELDVDDGFGERCIGGHQIFDSGVLLNCCDFQIIEGRSHLLHLFKFSGLVCTKCCVPGHHPIDVAHFGEGGSPMGLPVGPCVVGKWAVFHSHQAIVMLLHARACLVPVVIMVLSEMGTPALAAKTWHFSCFLV